MLFPRVRYACLFARFEQAQYALRKGKRSWKRVFRLFVSALALGFTIALPIGPISLLVINRTWERGWRTGFLSGIGVALADATYAAAAAFGLTALSTFLAQLNTPIRLVGALFLIYLAFRTMRARPPASATSADTPPRHPHPAGLIAGMWALTLTNPLTILMFASVFATAGLSTATLGDSGIPSWLLASITVLGIFAGSLCVWLLLCTLAALIRTRIAGRGLVWLNRVSGAALIFFAVRVLFGG